MAYGISDRFLRTFPGLIHGTLSLFSLIFAAVFTLFHIVNKFDVESMMLQTDHGHDSIINWRLACAWYFAANMISVTISIVYLPLWTVIYTSTSPKQQGFTPDGVRRMHYARLIAFFNTNLFGLWCVYSTSYVATFWGGGSKFLLVNFGVFGYAAYEWLAGYGRLNEGIFDGAGLNIVFDSLWIIYAGGPKAAWARLPAAEAYYIDGQVSVALFYLWGYFMYYLAARNVISSHGVRLGCRYGHLGMIVYLCLRDIANQTWNILPVHMAIYFALRIFTVIMTTLFTSKKWKQS